MLRLDLPGHGQSEFAEDVTDYTYLGLCDQLVEVIAQSTDELLLVGNSLGGHLAIDLTPRLTCVRGLIICGSPPLGRPEDFTEAFNPLPELATFFKADVSDAELDAVFRATCHEGCDTSVLKKLFRATDPRLRPALAQSIASGEIPDEVESLRNLEAAKYFLHPAEDHNPNMDYVRGLDVGLKVITMEGPCGHFPSFERPEQFRQIISQLAAEVFGTES